MAGYCPTEPETEETGCRDNTPLRMLGSCRGTLTRAQACIAAYDRAGRIKKPGTGKSRDEGKGKHVTNPNKICFACMGELPSEDAVCPACGHDNRLRGNGPGFLRSCVIGGQYMTGRVLGRGGFGITYLGMDLQLNRKVAIKEYYPDGVVSRDPQTQRVTPFGGSMQQTFEAGARRAVREARVAAQLEDIPNTVRIYSVLEANGTVYIVMEYIDGITLTDYVQKSGGSLRWIQAWPVIEPVLDTLSRIHKKGIVHRDVSPDNIMIRYADSAPVLLDFGTARDFTSGKTEHSVSLRLGFSPMEMYTSSSAIDQRSDEYAVMATLYYLLTGKKPESPLNVAAGIGAVVPPSRLGSDIPAGEGSAEEVLMKGLECRMEDRFPTVEALRQAFRRSLEQGNTIIEPGPDQGKGKRGNGTNASPRDKREPRKPPQDKPKGEAPKPRKKEQDRSNRLLVTAIAVVLVIVVALIGVAVWQDKKDQKPAAGTQKTAASSARTQHSNDSQPADQGTWTCTACHADNTYENFFCTNCGKTSLCLECGNVVPADDRYCQECGTETGTWKCTNCGQVQDLRNAFCENCAEERHAPVKK